MPKKLILFRHAKSDWDAGVSSDHARPLAKRGIRAARRMGRFLAKAGEVPEHILCSSAMRAVSTVQLAARAGDWGAPIDYRDTLYLPDTETLIREIRGAPDTLSALMLVGHEPTWSDLAQHLIGGRVAVRTATVLAFDLDAASWSDVVLARGTLAYALHPRMFDHSDWALS